MLALPADSRTPGNGLFHHRCRIDKDFNATVPAFARPATQPLETFFEDVVIILSSGIDADIASIRRQGGEVSGTIIHADHDNGFDIIHQGGGVGASFRRIGHPAHVAVQAFRNIMIKRALFFRHRHSGGEPDHVEA